MTPTRVREIRKKNKKQIHTTNHNHMVVMGVPQNGGPEYFPSIVLSLKYNVYVMIYCR